METYTQYCANYCAPKISTPLSGLVTPLKKKSMSLFSNNKLLIIFHLFLVNHDFTLSVLLGDIIYHILYLSFSLF